MFAPRQRKANPTGAQKGHRLKGSAAEQLTQPQQLVTNSLRWHHLSVTFWALMIAGAKRKVDEKGCQQFLDAMVWRIEGSISEAEFSQLYAVWVRPPNAQTESGQKKRFKRLSISELRSVLVLRKHTEADLDMMVSMLLFEQNRKILHTPLSQTEISFCTQEWISLVEQLFFHLDPAGYGYIFFDQMMFLCICLLDIHPNSEMSDFVVASCAVLQLIKEMKGVTLPPEVERTTATQPQQLPLEARNLVTLNMLKEYMRARGYSEAAVLALLQVVELRLRTLHEAAERLGAARSDVMRWFSVNQPLGEFTVPRCWEYVVAKSIGSQLGSQLSSNPFAAPAAAAAATIVSASPPASFNANSADGGSGYPSYVVYFAVDAPLHLHPELWLGATTDGVAANLLKTFAKQYNAEDAATATDAYLRLAQKIVSSYAIGVEQAFMLLQSIRIHDDCEELRSARPLVPKPPDGMDILMRYDVAAEQFSQHPPGVASVSELLHERQDADAPAASDTNGEPSIGQTDSSSNNHRRDNDINLHNANNLASKYSASTAIRSMNGQSTGPATPAHTDRASVHTRAFAERTPLEPSPAGKHTTTVSLSQRAQRLQVNSITPRAQIGDRQQPLSKLISLRQIEARIKDKLWPDEETQRLPQPPIQRAVPASQAAAVQSYNAAPSNSNARMVEEPSISAQLRTPASVGHLPATDRHILGEPASVEETHDELLTVLSLKDNLPSAPVPAQAPTPAPAGPGAAVQLTEPESELDSPRLGSGSIYGAASPQTDTPSAELRATRAVPAPSEHSAPSTVDELELFDQDAGRNAKALRAILRNMGKANSKLDYVALANIIKLGHEFVANDPSYQDGGASRASTGWGLLTRDAAIPMRATAAGQRSPNQQRLRTNSAGNSPTVATRASREAVPGRSPKQTLRNSSLVFGNRPGRSSGRGNA